MGIFEFLFIAFLGIVGTILLVLGLRAHGSGRSIYELNQRSSPSLQKVVVGDICTESHDGERRHAEGLAYNVKDRNPTSSVIKQAKLNREALEDVFS